VFSAPEGGSLRPANFRKRVFGPAVEEAGLAERFRIHDLRHTCAALFIAQGAHAKEIADRLGHSSPVVTMTVYAHILPSLDERLTTGLEETFRTVAQQ
jgi:integrase